MGCFSSKILAKSASFKEFSNRLQGRKTDGFEEPPVSKNGADQLVALFCASKSVARKLERDHEPNFQTRPENPSSESMEAQEPAEPENKVIETINTWEFLEGLEEDDEDEEHVNKSAEAFEDSKQIKSKEKGLRRKEMSKDLAALKVPAAFEFSSAGSLREWLAKGGQVFSPGSYVTPKFGSFSPTAADGEREEDKECDVFDPMLVAQIERAMEELTMEEEGILREIERDCGELGRRGEGYQLKIGNKKEGKVMQDYEWV